MCHSTCSTSAQRRASLRPACVPSLRRTATITHLTLSQNVVGRNSTTDFEGQPSGPFPPKDDSSWRPHAIHAVALTILAAMLGVTAAAIWYALGTKSKYEVVRSEDQDLVKKLAGLLERDVEEGLVGSKT